MPLTVTGEPDCVDLAALEVSLAAVGLSRVSITVDVGTLEGEVQVEVGATWRDRVYSGRMSRPPTDCPDVHVAIAQSLERATRDWPPIKNADHVTAGGVGLRLSGDPSPAQARLQLQVDHRRGDGSVAGLVAARLSVGTTTERLPAPPNACYPASACDDPRAGRVVSAQLGAGARLDLGGRTSLDLVAAAGPALWWGLGYAESRAALLAAVDVTTTLRWCVGDAEPYVGLAVDALPASLGPSGAAAATQPWAQALLGVAFGR